MVHVSHLQAITCRVRYLPFLATMFAAFASISVTAQPVIQPPAGFGNYCSLKNGAFGFGDINSDPCGSAPDSDIAFAGLWNTRGLNRAYVECSDGFRTWAASPIAGDASLQAAFNATTGHPNCKINVAPNAMPVFRAPWLFRQNLFMKASRGVDLALHGQTFSPGERCKSFAASAYELDNAGHVNWNAVSNDSNHSGYDWSASGNKPGDWNVRSVADGKVALARSRPVGAATNQNEIYIRYIVAKSLSSRYREEFIGYYAHMKSNLVKTGDIVTASQLIGPVGNTGAAGGTHLHFSVFRLRNVRGQFKAYFPFGFDKAGNITHNELAESRTIDPFGWNNASCVDAWGYHGESTRGAPSINLWGTRFVPPGWDHANH